LIINVLAAIHILLARLRDSGSVSPSNLRRQRPNRQHPHLR
jgi:hypothetical protein